VQQYLKDILESELIDDDKIVCTVI